VEEVALSGGWPHTEIFSYRQATRGAGTRDVDVVVDLQILANTEAYHTLEENLKKMRFERAENDKGQKLS